MKTKAPILQGERENVPAPTAQPGQKYHFAPRVGLYYSAPASNIWNQMLMIVNN